MYIDHDMVAFDNIHPLQGIVPVENVTAFLGLHDISNPHSSGKFRRYPVSQIIPAPRKQDIALIKVDGEIDIR